jgi:putative intracellular protease/amidase
VPEERYALRLCGLALDPVTAMGGLCLRPDITLPEIRPDAGNVLILPGGDTWLDPVQAPVLEMAGRFLKNELVIAAICGATMGLAQAGLLNSRPHTGNNLDTLKMFCPGYTGERYYVDEPAVTDGNLITASGLAPVDFACHVIRKLGVMRESTLDAWYNLHLTRRPESYYQLMESLSGSPEPEK